MLIWSKYCRLGFGSAPDLTVVDYGPDPTGFFVHSGEASDGAIRPRMDSRRCRHCREIHSFGGSAGTGALPSPLMLRALTRGLNALPGSGARLSTGWTIGSFALKA
jgi:hypothetical protein